MENYERYTSYPSWKEQRNEFDKYNVCLVQHFCHVNAPQQEAEWAILYNFYVDCMPSEDIPEASGRKPIITNGYFGGFAFEFIG